MRKTQTGNILLTFMLLTGFLLIRPMAVHAQKSNTFKVMTYNIHHGNPPDKPGVIDVDAIAAIIKKHQPDIVALQEVDVNTKRDGHINEIATIASKAGYKSFYFAKTIDLEGGQYGIAILSKYPLTNTATHKLPSNSAKEAEPRVLATALVHLPNNKTIQFGSTHLDAYHSDNRLLQIKEIIRLTGKSPYPFVIGGDFNSKESSEVIKLLDQTFTRTCHQCAPTFHEEASADGAIDYLAFRPAGSLKVISHQVLKAENASDHYPLVSVLAFEDKK
ncbi:endonuclease/exonuclease/phosphatase [Arachidicoccus ginsenosidivorans]|uniref:Endonuclease/exonuclease/phosphatase n=1 Tax=Arachidicoccus ginsenosidivorans TaxID=496057 RepID=A0A5B8VUG4_9BACT|nr:endonuclease/exonuclease/phosphatase family protein [Arachidicoccus ginsenosidivorans]QEC73788.1 endonuclease/exonuclease/phosphatase [Arachidicoccus ginsenosidivorans]